MPSELTGIENNGFFAYLIRKTRLPGRLIVEIDGDSAWGPGRSYMAQMDGLFQLYVGDFDGNFIASPSIRERDFDTNFFRIQRFFQFRIPPFL